MKDADDIVLLSLPFVVGLALSTLLGLPHSAWAASSALAAALVFLAAAVARQGRTGLEMAGLFFFLGCFRGLCSLLFPPSPAISFAPKSMDALSSAIMAIPFRHGESGALLLALFSGKRELLGSGTLAAFRNAGAAHLLALSGLHLGIIYLITRSLFALLGKSRALSILRSVALAVVSGFYCFMTGASPSIVRAFLFIVLNESALHFPGRRSSPISVWCTALLLQLLASPQSISSLSFQLSYLAMLGLLLIFPRLKAWYPAKTAAADPMRRIWNSMALALSCQVFTAPLAWLRFRTFPKYFLLTNLLALPLTELLMFGGLACIVLSAMKICPRALVEAVDVLARTLIGSLEIISSL